MSNPALILATIETWTERLELGLMSHEDYTQKIAALCPPDTKELDTLSQDL